MKPSALSDSQTGKLKRIGQHLIDQKNARVIVEPQSDGSGFWFGGGNMAQDADGVLWLIGRYRNRGDSRTGLHAGERGLELAVFRSDDLGESFRKVVWWAKRELDAGDRRVLSIEGAAIRFAEDGVEIFVSTEKSGIGYPSEIEDYLKPGTGVWTIDVLRASSIENIVDAVPETILESKDLRFIHIKDPFLADHRGEAHLLFCTHPFCWTSSNTGLVPIEGGAPKIDGMRCDFFPRGFTWDVAMTRGTSVMPLPKVDSFHDEPVSLFFYDGGECVRNLEEHASAIRRPRGYSCEELGGLAYCLDGDLTRPIRLSTLAPSFVSPKGTGCSRYVDVLDAGDFYYASWQQSQENLSQPLVLNKVSKQSVLDILESTESSAIRSNGS